MKNFIKVFVITSGLLLTGLSQAAIITFNDRAAFETYVGASTTDDLNTNLSGSGLDLSNADYSWTMSDYACTDSAGCNLYGSGNPFVSGSNDWVWTYGSGSFNFNFNVTAFGLDYANPFNTTDGSVGLNGFNSGTNTNGSFFGIATDDNTFLGSSISYTQFTQFQAFDNVIYSSNPNGQFEVASAPGVLGLFGISLLVICRLRKAK
ncbi:hypothetical protein [Alteromonas sp. W364]|uniref:hypothetical protein n=1 Tax=Alteromonas sp. W364 TaxID=3075610 RepID=UPI0028884AE8|nr:hypothetical protein [Alteromonas sp. W364]MDT0628755.1 hypothetical protein [Alteromonas sp. W364]